MRFKFWYIILVIFFMGCNQYKEENIAIATIIQDSGINLLPTSKNVVLIVPVIGCSSCIKQVKDFIRQIDEPNFLIIASCYSIKDFKFSFSDIELENKRYVIDDSGQAFRYELVDVGAKLYFLKGQKIVATKRFSCTEPDLLKQTLEFLGKN